jgi:glycosyltransferase involved in cell wall biosynthesis
MLVSVVIPIYNSEKSIIKCVQSVLDQTYRQFEIIIVDDGSKDNSLFILQDFIKEKDLDNTVKLISQTNQGPAKARNTGVDNSQGQWIAFLDSDDYWYSDKLEIQMNYMVQNPDVVLSSVAFQKRKFDSDIQDKIISFEELCFKNYFNTPGVVIKADIAKKFPFDVKKKYSEDFLCWLLICYQYKCLYINRVLCSNIENKAIYGERGLSANLWNMEKGELSNFKVLVQKKMINHFTFSKIGAYSLLKYMYRVINSKVLKH